MTLGDQGALDGVTAEEQQVVLPCDAALVGQPLGGVIHTVGDDVHEVRVADVVAACQHVGRELLGTVLETHVDLNPVARRGHLAAGQGSGATEDAKLLEQQNRLALVGGGDSGGKTGAAGTHNDDVVRIGKTLGVGRSGMVALLPSGDILAENLKGAADGEQESGAGQRGAGDGVDVERLVVDDETGEGLHGHVAQALRLMRVQDVDADDLVVFHDDLNVHMAVLANSLANSGTAHALADLIGKRHASARHRERTSRETCASHKTPAGKTRSLASHGSESHNDPLSLRRLSL